MAKRTWATITAVILAGLVNNTSSATTFTWTGGDGTTPWYSAVNWDSNGVPLFGTSLGTTTWDDLIIIDSEQVSYMPTDAIQISSKWSGGVWMIPQLHLRNGTITLRGAGFEWWFWGAGPSTKTLTIGDEDPTTTAIVNGQFSDWSRDVRGTYKTLKITVNSDGVLNNDRNITTWGESGIPVQLSINGGTVNFDSSFANGLTNQASSWISFDNTDASFTAKFGGQLPDLNTVQDNMGSGLSFRMGGSGHDDDVFLEALDNGNNTFTITFIDPPPQGTVIVLQ